VWPATRRWWWQALPPRPVRRWRRRPSRGQAHATRRARAPHPGLGRQLRVVSRRLRGSWEDGRTRRGVRARAAREACVGG
jgi:hypothetical protein